jgi:hypothetical protein
MARSDEPHGARGGRSSRPSLKETVSARSRDIAGAARFRVEDRLGPGEGGFAGARPAPAPPWLTRALAYLPAPVRLVLRDALVELAPLAAGAVDDLGPQREQLRQQRDDLRHREAAVDTARGELGRAGKLLEENRREVEGKSREAERLMAEARRAAAESAVERRVALSQVRVREADNPRPLRGLLRLAANIRRYGQLTPVVVVREGEGYRLVTGFRRMAALKLAGATHVAIRVVPELDERTAAALYIAENCLPDGISSKAVAHLAEQMGEDASPAFAAVLAEVQADDAEVVEEVYLEDIAEEARHHLAEGAAWVATLRPHWRELEAADRQPLVDLITYFARVQARLK